MKLSRLSVVELSRLLKRGEVTAVEVVEEFLDVIREEEEEVNAFIRVMEDEALERAATLDEEGRRGALFGIPFGVKDNISVKGVPTTCGSRILLGYTPPYSATVVNRIEREGGIVLGKCNMDEFAMGSTNEYSYFGPTCNPLDRSRVPGGSSGGTAAAVASGMVPCGLGSETGGSVRQPSSLCGGVGFKPTYGRFSRYGLVAFASSLDVIGVCTRSAQDAALLFGALAGPDPKESTSNPAPPSPLPSLSLRGLRVGVPWGYVEAHSSKEALGSFREGIRLLEEQGAEIVPLKLPSIEFSIAAYQVISSAEASSNLARYDGVRYGTREPGETLDEVYIRTRSEGFGPEVKRRIMLGTFVLSAGHFEQYYRKALCARSALVEELGKVFADCRLIATPTSPSGAPLLALEREPGEAYGMDAFTVQANLAKLPAISLPFGSDTNGMPHGFQLMAQAGEDELLLAGATLFEKAAGPSP